MIEKIISLISLGCVSRVGPRQFADIANKKLKIGPILELSVMFSGVTSGL